jgi:hypothetical protein
VPRWPPLSPDRDASAPGCVSTGCGPWGRDPVGFEASGDLSEREAGAALARDSLGDSLPGLHALAVQDDHDGAVRGYAEAIARPAIDVCIVQLSLKPHNDGGARFLLTDFRNECQCVRRAVRDG